MKKVLMINLVLLVLVAGVAFGQTTDGFLAYATKASGIWEIRKLDPNTMEDQPIITVGGGVGIYGGAISPDRSRLVFSNDATGYLEIYVVNMNGTGLTRLTFDGAQRGSVGNYHPCWVDGDWILFSTWRSSIGQREIFRIRADGSGLEQLTNRDGGTDSYTSPWVSPDRTHVTYSKGAPYVAATNKIYAADYPSFGNEVLVADVPDGPEWSPCWSSQNLLAFNHGTGGNTGIYTVSSAGSDLDYASGDPSYGDGTPRFSRNGDYLAMLSRESGAHNIWVMRTDGTERKQLTFSSVPEEIYFIDWGGEYHAGSDDQTTTLDWSTANWEGAGWCYNNGPSVWFPSVSGDIASLVRDDYCWGQVRTVGYIDKGQEISLEIQPFLTTGGVNEDAAMVGFTDGWAFYQGRFLGVRFFKGQILFYDYVAGVGLPAEGAPVLGAFEAGQWISLTMKVTTDGVFELNGPGIEFTYPIENIWSQFRLNIAMSDSEDGINVRNVTVGDGGDGSLQKDLVGHWNLDGDGSDSSPFGNNGSVVGAVPTVDRFGADNGAMYFDGVDDYIECGNDASLNIPGDQVSISTWIQTSYDASLNLEFPTIVSKGTVWLDGSSSFNTSYGLRLDNDNKAYGYIANTDSQLRYALSNVTLNDGAWHHVCLVYDGSLISLFVDGSQVSSTEQSGDIETITSSVAIGAAILNGSGYVNQPGYFFHGAIDDVRLFNYALSQAEIDELAEGGSSPGQAVLEVSPEIVNLGSETLGSFVVKNVGDADLTWSASESPEVAWLGISGRSSGMLPPGAQEYIYFATDPSQIPGGSGQCNIVVSSNGGEASVTVTANGSKPQLSVTGSVVLNSSSSRTITISNTGTEVLSWSASAQCVEPSGSWIWLNGATSGTVQPGGSTNIAVERRDKEDLAPRRYEGFIHVASNGGNADVLVSFDVPQRGTLVPLVDTYLEKNISGTHCDAEFLRVERTAHRAFLKFSYRYLDNSGYERDIPKGSDLEEAVLELYPLSYSSSVLQATDIRLGEVRDSWDCTTQYYLPLSISGSDRGTVVTKSGGRTAYQWATSRVEGYVRDLIDRDNPDGLVLYCDDATAERFVALHSMENGDPDLDPRLTVFFVPPAGQRQLVVSPTDIDAEGKTTSTIRLTLNGDEWLTWSAAENPDVPWLQMQSPASGALLNEAGENYQDLTLLFDQSQTSNSQQYTYIDISSNGGNTRIYVHLGDTGPSKEFVDLFPVECAGPSAVELGGQVEVTVTVRNGGTAPVSVPFDVEVFISSDGQEIPFGTTTIDGLAAGATSEVTVSAGVPEGLLAGRTYNWGCTIDPDGDVAEADEANNIMLGTVLDCRTHPVPKEYAVKLQINDATGSSILGAQVDSRLYEQNHLNKKDLRSAVSREDGVAYLTIAPDDVCEHNMPGYMELRIHHPDYYDCVIPLLPIGSANERRPEVVTLVRHDFQDLATTYCTPEGHFIIDYKQMRDNNSARLSECQWVAGAAVPNVVYQVGRFFEHALRVYQQLGFFDIDHPFGPSSHKVYIGPMYSPRHYRIPDKIELDCDERNYALLRFTASHELFHHVWSRWDGGTSDCVTEWIDESTCQLAADAATRDPYVNGTSSAGFAQWLTELFGVGYYTHSLEENDIKTDWPYRFAPHFFKFLSERLSDAIIDVPSFNSWENEQVPVRGTDLLLSFIRTLGCDRTEGEVESVIKQYDGNESFKKLFREWTRSLLCLEPATDINVSYSSNGLVFDYAEYSEGNILSYRGLGADQIFNIEHLRFLPIDAVLEDRAFAFASQDWTTGGQVRISASAEYKRFPLFWELGTSRGIYSDFSIVQTDGFKLLAVETCPDGGWPGGEKLVTIRPTCKQLVLVFHNLTGRDIRNPEVCICLEEDLMCRVKVAALSPVNLLVIDPHGSSITQDSSSLDHATYDNNIDENGEKHPTVVILNPVDGIYQVKITPDDTARPDDTYSLLAVLGSDTVVIVDEGRIEDIQTEGYLVSTLDTGSVTGVVAAGGTRLIGTPVDLYDVTTTIVATTTTDDIGRYEFAGLHNGDYSVSISTPLGYQAGEETKQIDVRGLPHEVNFELTQLEITPQQRSRGYWAHQLLKAIHLKNIDYTKDDFSNFAHLIDVHFNQNRINPVDFYSVPQPASGEDSLAVLKRLLHMQNTDDREPLLKRLAKSELMALMLNVVSGRVSQTQEITADGRTVSQLVTYCDMLVNDEYDPPKYPGCPGLGSPWFRYIYSSFMLTKANLGLRIPAGMVPEDVIQIAYKLHEDESLPTGFSLDQNYPNPFNPVTNIGFALPEASHVTLEIFNIMGQKVATLVNGNMGAGEHAVTWDASSVASGIYLYRLEAGDFVETRKMILLK